MNTGADKGSQAAYWSGSVPPPLVMLVWMLLATPLSVPNFIGDPVEGAVNRARADIRGIETAVHLYFFDNGCYPGTAERLAALVRVPAGQDLPGWRQQLARPPVDPWGRLYRYEYPGRHREFDVFTYGADGTQGGEGVNADVGNWEHEGAEPVGSDALLCGRDPREVAQ